MAGVDYSVILADSFKKLAQLTHKREEVELEIAKLQQLIRATVNMLPDDERDQFEAMLDSLAGESVGLTDAIRNVLKSAPSTWHTAVMVRDKLKKSGFDFSGYTSNPLASVHAVLKRLKPDEVETNTTEGVATYRWKARLIEGTKGSVGLDWLKFMAGIETAQKSKAETLADLIKKGKK